MPCKHKFHKHLNLNNLDFIPTTLIIGSFNPEWPTNNYSDWFYGRVKNNYFWEILPRIYSYDNLRKKTKTDWINFCKINKIAITDLISCINDADESNLNHVNLLKSFSDDSICKNFFNIDFVDIINILERYKSIVNVYFTRKTDVSLIGQKISKLENHLDMKKIRYNELLTPSGGARYQMTKGSGIKLNDFIFNKWKEKWHF